jgi:hypothetical protein
MRILGFSEKWPKLELRLPIEQRGLFTTFRFERRDRDWEVEELVQVVYKPRSKEREIWGIARIIRKQPKNLNKRWEYYPLPSYPNTTDMITPIEAEMDGFTGIHGVGDIEKMRRYFMDTYGYSRCSKEIINRLVLYWVNSRVPVPTD